MLKQDILSVVNYIATLPGFWQIVAYLSILALIVGFFRALPIVCTILWNLTKVFFHAILTYIWRGIRNVLRPLFRPFAPLFRPIASLFWRLCNAMGIWSPAQRRAEGYRWIPGFGWYQRHPIWNLKRDRQQTHEQTHEYTYGRAYEQNQKQAQEQARRQRQQQHGYTPQHDAPENPLQEACQFFNLPQDGNFDKATLQKRYLELMKALHPDKMRYAKKAADEFSKRINAANDLILEAKDWK